MDGIGLNTPGEALYARRALEIGGLDLVLFAFGRSAIDIG